MISNKHRSTSDVVCDGEARTTACTACGGAQLHQLLFLESVPVHQNLLYSSQDVASKCKFGNIDLRACEDCGFVFNATFDSALLDYSEAYENSQDKSGSFAAHMYSVAESLVERHSLRGKRILEIGCGKGAFLNLIVEIAGAIGRGFDPSYVNEFDNVEALSFVKDFFPSDQTWWSPDQIVCRHVLEHIACPLDFVSMIRRSIPQGKAPYLYFEVPSFDWICDNLAFWDIFYEHCNYFTMQSISSLVVAQGFIVERIAPVFSEQYLSVDVRNLDDAAPESPPWLQAEPSNRVAEYADLARGFSRRMNELDNRIRKTVGEGKKIAVWGAAAKGSTFLNQLKLAPDIVSRVIDINPRKQGNFIAGMGQLICAPESLQSNPADIIYVMNPNYEREIRQQLAQLSLFPELVVI